MMITVRCCFEMKLRTLIGPSLVITDFDVVYISKDRSRRPSVGCQLSLRKNMLCILWLLLQALAVVVEGGESSGSAEALINGALKNKAGAAAGNGAAAGTQNGAPLPGALPNLVQLGGTFLLQPVGNPVGQAPLQQLTPITALQQGGTLFMVQAGGANANLQGQGAQQAGGAPITLLAVLPQSNAGGNPQPVMLAPGQVQLIPMAGLNNQQQLVGAGGGGTPAGRLRFQRSVAARLRRTESPVKKVTAADEEEECSGMDTEENQVK